MNGVIIIGGYIQGLSNVRALGEHGVPVWVIDEGHCLAQKSRYCKRMIYYPSLYDAAMVSFLVELCKQNSLQNWLLLPSDDNGVIYISNHAEELSCYATIVPSPGELEQIVNKRKLLQLAEKVGTPIPRTCYPEQWSEAERLSYPIMIKGNYGLEFFKVRHKKAYRVDTYEQLEETLSFIWKVYNTDEFMIQEMIPFDPANRVLSFTCFAIKGEIKSFWMGDKLRERPLQFGTATLARSVNKPDVLKDATPLIKALHYTGVCEVEMMRDPRDGIYKLIEINPRTWMWVGLAKECGIEYAWMLYCYANKIEYVYPQSYALDVKWRNAYTDMVYSWEAMLTGKLTWKDYRNSLKGKIVGAVWSWKDIRPGIYFPCLLAQNVIKKIARVIRQRK